MKLVTTIISLITIEHKVLVDKPDYIDAIKESDIHEDANHNVEGDEETQLDDEDDIDGGNWETRVADTNDNVEPDVQKSYDASTNSYTEEVKDPQGRFYQKKVVQEGPGFKSVSFMTSSRGGGVQGGPMGGDMIANMLGALFGAAE